MTPLSGWNEILLMPLPSYLQAQISHRFGTRCLLELLDHGRWPSADEDCTSLLRGEA